MSGKPATPPEGDAWVLRVLGLRIPARSAIRVAAPAALAAARPAGPPKSALMDNLATTMARAAPATAESLPGILSEMIPRFLLAIQSEPSMKAEPLAPGGAVPKQDQLLGVADTLNAVMRSARLWESLLDSAETSDKELDVIEAAERDAKAQAQYEGKVGSYNATRTSAAVEQERCLDLTNQLMAEFRAVQAAAA